MAASVLPSAHVFYVDDDSEVSAAVAKTLRRLGLSISCFTIAEDCINNLNDGSCDLLVTDLRLPGKNGLELLSHVRIHHPWLPVILLTQYGDVETAVQAMKMGAVDFIEKPFEAEKLRSAIRSSLKRSYGSDPKRGKPLTRTERKVLFLILAGKSNAEAAAFLHRSTSTIEVHRKNIMRKLGAHNAIDLALKAAAMGFDRPTPED